MAIRISKLNPLTDKCRQIGRLPEGERVFRIGSNLGYTIPTPSLILSVYWQSLAAFMGEIVTKLLNCCLVASVYATCYLL